MSQVNSDFTNKLKTWVAYELKQQELSKTHNQSLADLQEARDNYNKELEEKILIQKEVEKSNSHMPQVQQVRKFHLFTKELDHDDGEVTATMKVKRKSIYEKYTVEIETMYA